MKKLLAVILFKMLFILPTFTVAQTINLQILDSLTNKPIENVYIYTNEKKYLSVSDRNGMCQIIFPDSTLITHQKDAYISHVGYAGKVISLTPSMSNHPAKVLLSPKIFELSEVTIIFPNAGNIVQKAIENISKNYPSLQGDTLALNVSFIFLDSPNSKIADFKGKVALTKDENHLLAAKYEIKNDLINDSFYDYGNEISPSGFYSVIFVQNHAPIRLFKKFDFHYDGMTKYQGNDVYKISFIRKKKYNNISGYMLIGKNDYAITYITYKIGEINKWIAATQKSMGIIYTNLEGYEVSVSYVEGIKGYKFSEGSINMLFNRTKKKQVLSNNTYDVSVKAIETPHIPDGLIYLNANELFDKK
ncbi:MAG: hypothetical protein JXR65_04550 [Bacteroidales bacterium]|nr:hypothetical protein [Bacteroidales bacterium]